MILKNIKEIVIILLLIIGGYLGYQHFFTPPTIVEKPIVTIQRDTITKIDTIIHKELVYVDREVVKHDTITVETENGDISINIPISRYRFFEDNEYDMLVDGYNVSVIEIKTFPKTIIEYQIIEKTIVEKPKYTFFDRFNWGIAFGPSYDFVNKNLGMSLVVGLTFDLTKKK